MKEEFPHFIMNSLIISLEEQMPFQLLFHVPSRGCIYVNQNWRSKFCDISVLQPITNLTAISKETPHLNRSYLYSNFGIEPELACT